MSAYIYSCSHAFSKHWLSAHWVLDTQSQAECEVCIRVWQVQGHPAALDPLRLTLWLLLLLPWLQFVPTFILLTWSLVYFCFPTPGSCDSLSWLPLGFCLEPPLPFYHCHSWDMAPPDQFLSERGIWQSLCREWLHGTIYKRIILVEMIVLKHIFLF